MAVAHVIFTQNIQRHVTCPPTDAAGSTVREVLDQVFAGIPGAREYVLDDQGAVRRHMVVFVNGQQIEDRVHLSDRVPPDGEVYVMQALSGG
jgi:sulfur-carrier protein